MTTCTQDPEKSEVERLVRELAKVKQAGAAYVQHDCDGEPDCDGCYIFGAAILGRPLSSERRTLLRRDGLRLVLTKDGPVLEEFDAAGIPAGDWRPVAKASDESALGRFVQAVADELAERGAPS